MLDLIKKYILSMVVLLGFQQAYAQNTKLSAEDQRLYYLTYNSCTLFLAEGTPKGAILTYLNPQAIDVMVESFADINHMMEKYLAGDTKAFDRLKNNRGLGLYMHTLLQSEGFSSALNDCFPNESYRKAYVADLLLFDAIGNYFTVAAAAYGYYSFLKWSYAYIHLSWVKALFLGHVATVVTADTPSRKQSLADMLKDQYQNLSDQIEALLKQQKK